jgi:hypothetical protein
MYVTPFCITGEKRPHAFAPALLRMPPSKLWHFLAEKTAGKRKELIPARQGHRSPSVA